MLIAASMYRKAQAEYGVPAGYTVAFSKPEQ
jgi:membrane-bound lytic murein transglycosylase B